MKEVRICFEVRNLGVDENGNSVPAGMQFTLGEIEDEKYDAINYFEAMAGVKGPDLLKAVGMGCLSKVYSEGDFRIISPEEYDEKYGEAAHE